MYHTHLTTETYGINYHKTVRGKYYSRLIFETKLFYFGNMNQVESHCFSVRNNLSFRGGKHLTVYIFRKF